MEKTPEMQSLLSHQVLQDNVLMLPLDFNNSDVVVHSKQYDDKPYWALVISVGEGRLLENGQRVGLDIEYGDVVVFQSYGATVIKSLGVDWIVVRQEDIISVYRE